MDSQEHSFVATVNPTEGDVIERNSFLFRSFASLREARAWGRKWYRAGPNGPARSAMYFHMAEPIDAAASSIRIDRHGWPVGATLLLPGHPIWEAEASK